LDGEKKMSHPYDDIAAKLGEIYAALAKLGLDDVLAKGVGNLLLARELNHKLIPGDKGADAHEIEDVSQKFEYKVSISDQFNFNFGARKREDGATCETVVGNHFKDIAGTYCAARKDAEITRVVYCESAPLIADLVDHFEKTSGGQLNKVYRIETFLSLKGARDVKRATS
jgi:hypothetical protein